MKLVRLIIAAGVILKAASGAAIDFTTGINTGVEIKAGSVFRNGMVLEHPLEDFLAKRPYTAQIVPTGSDADISEAYVQLFQNKGASGSALANGKGALEVGVQSNEIGLNTHYAVSRYYTTIKNNTENELDFDFFFQIQDGRLVIEGTRYANASASASFQAKIDYFLRTPDEGTYIDSTGSLFNYWAYLSNQGRHGMFEHSANVTSRNGSDNYTLYFYTAPYQGKVELPTIPGYGELTIYYDMTAIFRNVSENRGAAFLGDPTQLVPRTGASIVARDANAVPEPGTFLLLGITLLAAPVLRRIKR